MLLKIWKEKKNSFMVFGYLLEPHIEIDQEIFFNDFFL
jgi:hypothetical protein